MSSSLEIALFVACVAVVLLVLVLIPCSILLYRRAKNASQQLEAMKADLQQLVHDSREMVQNINKLSVRANQQMDEVEKIVGNVRQSSERANQLFNEVSTVVESPLVKMAQGFRVLRQVWKFFAGPGGKHPAPEKDLEGSPKDFDLPES